MFGLGQITALIGEARQPQFLAGQAFLVSAVGQARQGLAGIAVEAEGELRVGLQPVEIFGELAHVAAGADLVEFHQRREVAVVLKQVAGHAQARVVVGAGFEIQR